jgi:hypothetical protein
MPAEILPQLEHHVAARQETRQRVRRVAYRTSAAFTRPRPADSGAPGTAGHRLKAGKWATGKPGARDRVGRGQLPVPAFIRLVIRKRRASKVVVRLDRRIEAPGGSARSTTSPCWGH